MKKIILLSMALLFSISSVTFAQVSSFAKGHSLEVLKDIENFHKNSHGDRYENVNISKSNKSLACTFLGRNLNGAPEIISAGTFFQVERIEYKNPAGYALASDVIYIYFGETTDNETGKKIGKIQLQCSGNEKGLFSAATYVKDLPLSSIENLFNNVFALRKILTSPRDNY